MNRRITRCALLLVALTLAPLSSFAADAKFYKIGTASSGGLFNALGISFAQVWTKALPEVSFSAQITGGSGANALGVNGKKYDIGLIVGDVTYDAYNGLNQFKDKPQKDLRIVANLYPAVMQVIVLRKSGINTVDDIKGKNINIGQAGSGSAIAAELFLKWFGLDADKNYTGTRLSHSAGADAVMDEKIDGYVNLGTVGQSWHVRVFSSGKAAMVPFGDERTKKFIEAVPAYYAFTIPANAYPNQDKPIPTVATSTLLVVHKDMNADHVYAITKALFDNIKELGQLNNIIADLTPKAAVDGMSIPMHPGAERYFKEVGVLR